MFKKSMSVALAALLAVSASLPAAAPAEARNRGGKIAAGIALGVVAGALLANSSRAHARDYNDGPRYRSRGASACERWAWKCDNGNDWACRKFDNNC